MRISQADWAMGLAKLTAQRSTCLRRHVGCVLLSVKGHVLATGYNGVASGQPHCNEEVRVEGPPTGLSWPPHTHTVSYQHLHACSGAFAASGTDLDGCESLHAEQNALLQCQRVDEIDICYCTASPCFTCTKLLLNTSCRRIVFQEVYPHPAAGELWQRAGRTWKQLHRLGQPGGAETL